MVKEWKKSRRPFFRKAATEIVRRKKLFELHNIGGSADGFFDDDATDDVLIFGGDADIRVGCNFWLMNDVFGTDFDSFHHPVVDKSEVVAGGEESGGHIALERLDEDAILLQFAVGVGRVEGDEGGDPVGVAATLERVTFDEFGIFRRHIAVKFAKVALERACQGREVGRLALLEALAGRVLGGSATANGGGKKHRKEQQITNSHNIILFEYTN